MLVLPGLGEGEAGGVVVEADISPGNKIIDLQYHLGSAPKACSR
jgi:hypothetical protein